MSFNSKKYSLLVLGITSLACSRALFSFFNDPEGPNLVVGIAIAAILYVPSIALYLLAPPAADFKRLGLAILLQMVLAAGLYFLLT